MKKILVALVASFGILVAGGNIAPVAPVVVEQDNTGFYVGGFVGSDWTYTQGNFEFSKDTDDSQVDALIGLAAGYTFYTYGDFDFAVEGRVSTLVETDKDFGDSTTYDLFVKPTYNIAGTDFGVYALGGWSWTKWDNVKEDGFAWGLGAKYNLTKKTEVYVDYVSHLWNKDIGGVKDVNHDSVQVGFNYKF